MKSCSFLAFLVLPLSLISLSRSSEAATRRVPSEYPTIQAAIDAASSFGDSVSVAPGIYSEALSVSNKHLTLLSEGSSSNTSFTSIVWTTSYEDPTGNPSVVKGFSIAGTVSLPPTFQGSFTLSNCVVWGTVQIRGYAEFFGSLDLESCEFHAPVNAGWFGTASSTNVTSCRFEDADAVLSSNGFARVDSSRFDRARLETEGGDICEVSHNIFSGGGGLSARGGYVGLDVHGNELSGSTAGMSVAPEGEGAISSNVLTDCGSGISVAGFGMPHYTVSANRVLRCGGGITVTGVASPSAVEGNTVWRSVYGIKVMDYFVGVSGNTVGECTGDGIYYAPGIEELQGLISNISVGNSRGVVVSPGVDPGNISCNDIWSNSGGDWVGIPDPTGSNGNFSADPTFCCLACACSTDTSALYTLAVNSPCLAGNSPCGELIGSEGQGCDSVLVWVGKGNGTSWGDPYNWNAGRIPQAGDQVQISRGVGDHVRLLQAATIAELTLCGRGSVQDTLEIGLNGQLTAGKIHTTEEILLTEGEAVGRGGGVLTSYGRVVLNAGMFDNLPGGHFVMEAGGIGGSGTFLNYRGAGFSKRGTKAGEIAMSFVNGGAGAPADTASAEVLEGILTLSAGLLNGSVLTVGSGAVLAVNTEVTNQEGGVFELAGDAAGGGVVENYGFFKKTGAGASALSVAFKNERDVTGTPAGIAQILEGTLVSGSLLENKADLLVAAGAVLGVEDSLSNLKDGSLELRGDISGAGTIANRGLFRKTSPETSSVAGAFENISEPGAGVRGRIEIPEGKLVMSTVQNQSTVSISAGTAVRASSSFAHGPGATLEGGGTLDVSGTTFTNEGTVSPGSSSGTLSLVGDFTQSPSAEINMEIGGKTPGTQHDVLSITGSAAFSGALHVNYVGGFTPSPGDTFTLIRINEGSREPEKDLPRGGFQCFSGLQLPGGLFMNPVDLPDAFLLVAIDSVPPNNAPLAEPDMGSTDSATPLLLYLVENDSDADADRLTIATICTEKTGGQVFLNAGDTTVTYVPPFVFGGTDTFTYVVTDCKGASDSAVVTIDVRDVSDVPPGRLLPTTHQLLSNYPNPFNPITTIKYRIAWKVRTTLKVYDVEGRLVRTLVEGEIDPGLHQVVWDGKSESGHAVASGVYFCRLETPDYAKTRKMVLLK